MTDERTLGEVLHEAREAGNDGRDRPLILLRWADRDPRLKALDEDMAAAVEAEVRVRAAAEIRARARQLWPPGMHREELDMAAAAVVKGQERSDEKEASHGEH